MKRFFVALSLLVFSSVTTYCSQEENYSFYIKVGSGISFSECVNVVAAYPPWDPAAQGYNSKLGNCPIAALNIGCELFHIVDLDVSISNRSLFKYKKFQTSTIRDESYIRNFDLNVTSILFSANLLGRGIPCLHWDTGCGKIYPQMGAGIGVSDLLITNFRTTGLLPTGDSSPRLSFSAENQYTLRQNFTYTLLAGIEYSSKGNWAIGTGYRWVNAGCFKGPQYLRLSGGSAIDMACDQWGMRFRANEWFLEFKIFI